ncbi:hypothetical protein [Rhodopirellula baltica]
MAPPRTPLVVASSGMALQTYQEAHCHRNSLLWADEIQQAAQDDEICNLETFLEADRINHPEVDKRARSSTCFDPVAAHLKAKQKHSGAYDGLSTATVFGMQ